MIARRHLILPIAAVIAAPSLPLAAHTPKTSPAAMPERYDDPLGIGLEGWLYPAPVHFFQLSIDGQIVRMAYMDIAPKGTSRNQTVVLLHGKNFDSSYWAGPIEDLSGAGYRVIVPDQIGFNKSSKPDLAYSFDMLAEATINLLGSLQVHEATIIGHSTGGMLAVRIATAFPEHVQKLVLEDPIGLIDYRRYIPPQTTDTLVANERRQTVASYRAFVRHFFPLLPAAAMEPFVEWRMRVAQSSEYERFCKASALTYQMIYREPVRDEYRDIRAKTLMFAGTADESAPLKAYAPPEIAAKIPSIPQAAPDAVKDIPNARLVSVPNVGHVPHLEAPDLFRKTLLDFLAG
ncbi:alpha/beta fold hydrolase [Beijerinckia sp. L45]|uniref:alpha/beta fold hydrolase n=1 Tax=Beijerinckia sp. L45 TaxID=1641855 RepID=UPI00131C05A2|nr:alpha/beta hydrolase [Beijerinckia sp. L45]